MGNSPGKAGRYEAPPVQIWLPGVPHLAQLPARHERRRGEVHAGLAATPFQAITTLPTNVQCAIGRGLALVTECERLIGARDLPALCRLIVANPELALDRRIRDAVSKLSHAARYRPGPGRSEHSHRLSPLLVVGMVHDVIRAGEAGNPSQAFYVLETLNVGTAEGIARAYYRALGDERFRGLLVELRQSDNKSTEEAKAALRNGEWLRPGGQIRRRVYIPLINDYVEVVFTATEDGPASTRSVDDKQDDNILVVSGIRIPGLDHLGS